MVQIEDLTKNFDDFTALNGLNLNIKKGSIYGLVGVNGSGKTTAIKHLAGIYRQDSGRVYIDNTPVYDNAALKARVGYIPDELYFFPHYSMKMQRSFLSRMYEKWNDQRYRQLVNLLELDEKRRLSKFSKGMQKQAAFIFAMSIMPDFLLLDEPIDGLDPIVRKVVFEFMIEDVAQRELTVLISSHNLKEMDGICDAIGIIKNGRMTIERDLDDLKADVHKVQVAFSAGTDDVDKYRGLDILHKESRGGVELLVVRGKADEVSERIRTLQPLIYDHLPLTLEEVFIYENTSHDESGALAGNILTGEPDSGKHVRDGGKTEQEVAVDENSN